MTTEALNDFTDALRTSEEMAEGLIAAMAGKTEGEAPEVLAAYARECGYAVTRQDAEGFRAGARAGEGTPSDEQRDGVSGGRA